MEEQSVPSATGDEAQCKPEATAVGKEDGLS